MIFKATRGRGVDLVQSACPRVLKDLVGVPFRIKGQETHKDRDGIVPFLRKLPFNDPRTFPDDPRPDEPGLLKFAQPHDEDTRGQAGKRMPDPVDLIYVLERAADGGVQVRSDLRRPARRLVRGCGGLVLIWNRSERSDV